MLPPNPPDPYNQSGQTGATEHFDTHSAPASGQGPGTPHPYRGAQADTPLPLPYDDYDPTYQTPPPRPPQPSPTYPEAGLIPYGQPPAHPVPYQQHGRGGQAYAPPPIYVQPPPQPQVIYVPERRPSWFSLSCRILAIILLMACGLIGLGIFRGVTSFLETESKAVPAHITVSAFCAEVQSQNYQSAYGDLSSQLQQQVSESDFQQTSQALDHEHGYITNCTPSNDTVNGNTVTFAVNVSRGSIYYTGNVELVQQGSDWRINEIDTSLDLG